MPRGGGGGGGRSYVDNSYNRSVGRVGMPVGSMVISSGSTSASGCSSGQTSSYAANNSISASSSAYSSYSGGGGGRTYVDNAQNRSLGRAGLPVGSMPVSSSSAGSSVSAAPKTYVDNSYNRKLDRAGKEHGTVVVSKGSSASGDYGGKPKVYVNDSSDKGVGLSYDSGGSFGDVKVYKDNALNRQLGRVGKPLGSAVYSKSGSNGDSRGLVYTDNSANRQLGRAGFPLGSRPKSSFSGEKRTYSDNSLNRARDRVGCALGTKGATCSKETEWLLKAYQGFREYPDEDINYEKLPSLPEETREEAIDDLLHLLNRLQFEKEWREKSTKDAEPVPKTSDNLLKYSGPTAAFSDITLGKVIGRGGFGVVYHATYKESVVAVKMLHVTRVSKQRQAQFNEEVNILSKLDNPYIVKFIGACIKAPNLGIVMEYMQMSLHEALHVDCADLADFTDENRLMMIIQTLSGMEYLHGKNLAHCDIKSKNILIDHDGEKFTVAKLTDFGLSLIKNETETSLSSSHEVQRNIGTPRYSAPEVLRGELLTLEQYKISDMYSYALVVFEIICEEEPFANLNSAQLRTQVGDNNLFPQFPKNIRVNVSLMTQLLACWGREPAARPTASSFLKVVDQLSCVYGSM